MKKLHKAIHWVTLYTLAFTATLANAGSATPTVPEPNIITLFAAGAIAIALVSKYRKK